MENFLNKNYKVNNFNKDVNKLPFFLIHEIVIVISAIKIVC